MNGPPNLWVIAFFAICGGGAGVLAGAVVNLLIHAWMHDGEAFVLLCGVCGAIIGLKFGQHKTQ
jgi:uncharacterized membrane protein YsdA (DUF1294 family)